MRTSELIAAVAFLASGASWAQADGAALDSEEQLRRQIAELQTENGIARPAAVVDPLRALALLYEEAGNHALASATLEEARHVTRIHYGLTSAEEALVLRQQIRSEKALGQHHRAWALEHDMVTTARRHHDDVRMLPIFRELAEDRVGVIEQVRAGERPPMIYAGCYNAEPLPPYDYKSREPRLATASGITSPSCIGGINQDIIDKLRSEILLYYADAIEVILRTGDYASRELRELERAAIRIAGQRSSWSSHLSSDSSSGQFRQCGPDTLDHYLALDILSSCLAPVARGNNMVIANVGGPISVLRLLSYEVRSGAPAADRATALAELADWHVAAVPTSRRRFLRSEVAYELYRRAYDELQQSGDLDASARLFAPELPLTLPASEPGPFVPMTTEPPRYLDVSFDVTKYGTAERVQLLDTSRGASRAEQRELLRLLGSSSFRPRLVDGKVADAAPVVARYRLP